MFGFPSARRHVIVGLLAVVTASCASASGDSPSSESSGSSERDEPVELTEPAVVVLDPGHNGGNVDHPDEIAQLVPAGFGREKPCNTVGTSTDDGYPEHAFTFDVARRTEQILTDQGIDVRMTRTDDTSVGPCVNERAAVGNTAGADAVVSIHADGSRSGHGFHVIEASRPPAGPDTAAASHGLAVAVHQQYAAGSGFTPATYVGDGGGFDARDDLAGLNLSQRPTIFLECGNMRDPGDAERMRSPDGRARIADALAAGILAYLANR